MLMLITPSSLVRRSPISPLALTPHADPKEALLLGMYLLSLGLHVSTPPSISTSFLLNCNYVECSILETPWRRSNNSLTEGQRTER